MHDTPDHTFLIRPREQGQVNYFLLLFFLLGCGMAIGRYSADALFFKRYGIEFLPLMYMAHGLMLVVVSALYAAYADKLAPERLLIPLGVILILLLSIVWWLMAWVEWEQVYPIYFLICELASEIFLVHCTLYLSRNFDALQSKRLLPVIFSGWQFGAILGSLFLSMATPLVGVQNMPLVWLCLVGMAMLVAFLYHHRAGVSPYHRAGRKGRKPFDYTLQQLSQGVAFASKSALLKAMSMALFFMVISFYVLSYAVNRVYTMHFADENSLTVFFGWLGVATGLAAVFLQVFVSNRLIRRVGVRSANLIFPSFMLLSFAGLLAVFALPVAILGSAVKDAIMPAIRNPVRALFFNALPGFIQGRAHALSVGVVLPLALLITGVLLLLAQSVDDVYVFLIIGFFTAIAYGFFNWRMNKAYLQSIIEGLRDKLFVPDEQFNSALQNDEQQVFKLLAKAAQHEEAEIRFMAAMTLMESLPQKAPPIVLSVIAGLDAPLRDQLIAKLAPLEPPELKAYLYAEVNDGDDHLKATALLALFHLRSAEAKDLVSNALDSDNPRIRAAGIFGALNYPVESLVETAKVRWREQLRSDDKGQVIAALNLLARWPQPEFLDVLLPHLCVNDKRVCLAAIGVLDHWPEQEMPGFPSIIAKLMDSTEPQIRAAAAQHLRRLHYRARLDIAKVLLEDDHPEVRQCAALVLFPATDPVEKMEIWLLDNQHSPKAQQAVLDLFLSRRARRDAWERIARCFSARAAQFYAAYLALDRNAKLNDGLDLLRIVLRERALQTLDLTLFSAMQYEDKSSLGVIRAGVRVKDKRQWASTIEAVRYLEDKSLARSLTALLESMSGDTPKEITRRWRFREISSVLDWVKEQGDPWVTQCAVEPSST